MRRRATGSAAPTAGAEADARPVEEITREGFHRRERSANEKKVSDRPKDYLRYIYIYYYHHRKHRKHSTAQSTRTTSSKASTRRSEQTVGSRQHVVEHTYSSLCSQNERRNQNLLGLQKYCWWCDARRVYLYTAPSFRPSYFVHYTCSVRVVFGDHGALGNSETFGTMSIPTIFLSTFLTVLV